MVSKGRIYGVDRKPACAHGCRAVVASFGSNRQAAWWPLREGRSLYRVPRGWRRPRVDSQSLAAAIEAAGERVEGAA